MTIRKFTFSLLLASGFVFAHPVGTIGLLTLDNDSFQAASAKNNGNGNSGNAGNNGNGGGKSASNRGNSSVAKSNNGRGKSGNGGNGVKNFFDKLFSKPNKAAATASRPGNKTDRKKPAKVELANLKNVAVPKVRPKPEFGILHPRNMGKLNGAYNSSPQAKLAHILNGNFNGPVGLTAALWLAEYNLEQATTASAVAAAYSLVGNMVQEDIDAAIALAAESEDTSNPDYTQAVAVVDARNLLATLSDEEIAAALTLAETAGPSATEVEAAKAQLLALYKGGELETMEEKEQLLAALMSGYDDNFKDAIALALAEQAEEEAAEAPLDETEESTGTL